MRFLFAFIKDGNNLVKIGMDDGKERWMTTSTAVYGFAKKALKGTDKTTGYAGDEVKVTYTEENGKYNATRIEKIGGGTDNAETRTDGKPTCTDCGKELKDNKYTKCYLCNKKSPVKSEASTEGKYVCADCGATLKDDKYKKCYTCNQKNPAPKSKSLDGKFRTPEQITKDEIGHMTARTMVALAGVVDPNNVTDVMRKIYKVYQELVG